MRTLVVGIPLPHVSFDNYSFIYAPSFSDYPRMIVEMAAISRVVEEVAAGSAEHRTYAGQPLVDGPASAQAFSLADLLAMRRREAERFLQRGGVLACLAHPDAPHPNLASAPGWRRYDWLPSPEGFRYQEHLLPGFGNQAVILEEVAHPFAPYVEAAGPRLAYRVCVDEDAPGFREYSRLFARSPGGAAVGVELHVEEGRVVLLPPLSRFEAERAQLAATLFECLERCWAGLEPDAPEWMRKELS